MNKQAFRIVLYLLCLYDIYLYLPDIFDVFKIDIHIPYISFMVYFDAAMLLFGGIILGWALFKKGGTFNIGLGVIMLILNLVITPLFIIKAIG
ncbi:hypothetical protein [Mucilaginibacter segetis]|uniref:Uncharacterized protein n=1 Tax=Mucilaginibacter segetis TaxID=2793071 RepID=A0A934PTX0_9SPHI|nr:hypothetical protein [Mucilaginibacter segetis]MBK0380763.1 hypothetical protein [Mucilaginibacter segetis]